MRRPLSLLVAGLVLTGCGDGISPPVPTAVSVTPPTADLRIGQTVSLASVVTDELGQPMSVTPTWSSSNTSVATVVGGQVLGVSPGVAQVSASYSGLSASAVITVLEPFTISLSATGISYAWNAEINRWHCRFTMNARALNGLPGEYATWTSGEAQFLYTNGGRETLQLSQSDLMTRHWGSTRISTGEVQSSNTGARATRQFNFQFIFRASLPDGSDWSDSLYISCAG